MTLPHATSASAGLLGVASVVACGPDPEATFSVGGAGIGLDGWRVGIATGALGGDASTACGRENEDSPAGGDSIVVANAVSVRRAGGDAGAGAFAVACGVP